VNIPRFVTAMAFTLLTVPATTLSQDAGVHRSHDNDQIVQKLLTQAKKAQLNWLSGDSGPSAAQMAHTPRFTIFGPFGGPSPPGWSDEFAKIQASAARPFRGGTTSIELVQSHVADDLIVLITIERNQVKFAGSDRPQQWDLRVTQVYRRDGADWKVIHRHADPLVVRRNLAQTLQLFHP
jgi:ketosteroid isomerase-like protein